MKKKTAVSLFLAGLRQEKNMTQTELDKAAAHASLAITTPAKPAKEQTRIWRRSPVRITKLGV